MENHYHHHYDHYDPNMIQRLDGFYGKVEEKIHNHVLRSIVGPKVLDIGCGYGSLVNYLDRHAFDAHGIDQHEPSIIAGKEKYPHINIECHTKGLNDFSANSYNTIILKDVVHHIYDEDDIVSFLKDAYRICQNRLIIIDPNPMPLLKLARKLIGHVDPVCPPEILKKLLKETGFKEIHLTYGEVIAFPLSGGYVGPNWIRSPLWMRFLLSLDKGIEKLLAALRLQRFFCWRYYVVASK